MTASKTYILIDFENVQPMDFEALAGVDPLKVIIFLGAGQKSLQTDFVMALHRTGHEIEYVRASGMGSNALDFHIAFHIGRISTSDPHGIFRIISKDKGFDPLIHHMNELGVRVSRSKQLARERPVILKDRSSCKPSSAERVDSIVKILRKSGENRPKTIKTLTNSIATWLPVENGSDDMKVILDLLQLRKVVAFNDQRVSYAISR